MGVIALTGRRLRWAGKEWMQLQEKRRSFELSRSRPRCGHSPWMKEGGICQTSFEEEVTRHAAAAAPLADAGFQRGFASRWSLSGSSPWVRRPFPDAAAAEKEGFAGILARDDAHLVYAAPRRRPGETRR